MGDAQLRRSQRRSGREVEKLVAEYESSGLGRMEFCRTHALSLSTLNRYRRRRQAESEADGVGPLVAVEVADSRIASGFGGAAGLSVILSGGRRIDIARGFDAVTLDRLLERLERA